MLFRTILSRRRDASIEHAFRGPERRFRPRGDPPTTDAGDQPSFSVEWPNAAKSTDPAL